MPNRALWWSAQPRTGPKSRTPWIMPTVSLLIVKLENLFPRETFLIRLDCLKNRRYKRHFYLQVNFVIHLSYVDQYSYTCSSYNWAHILYQTDIISKKEMFRENMLQTRQNICYQRLFTCQLKLTFFISVVSGGRFWQTFVRVKDHNVETPSCSIHIGSHHTASHNIWCIHLQRLLIIQMNEKKTQGKHCIFIRIE